MKVDKYVWRPRFGNVNHYGYLASQARLFRAVAELTARESHEEEELLPELLQRSSRAGAIPVKAPPPRVIHVRLAQRLRGRAWLARLTATSPSRYILQPAHTQSDKTIPTALV